MKEDVKKWEVLILIVKKINMLNSKSLILKLACRHKSTAHRFNIKKGYLFFSYYFLARLLFCSDFHAFFRFEPSAISKEIPVPFLALL